MTAKTVEQVRAEHTAEVDRLIRARVPVIAVSTWEEERVEGLVTDIAQAHGKHLFTWSYSQGMALAYEAGSPVEMPAPDELREPSAALRFAYNWQPPARDPQALTRPLSDEAFRPALFIMFDLGNFLARRGEELAEPEVVRWVRDIAGRFQRSRNTLIIVGANLSLPDDLAKSVTVIDWPLPSYEELAAQLEQSLKAMPSAVKVKLPAETRDSLVRTMQGLTMFEAVSAVSGAAVRYKAVDARAIAAINAEKRQIVRKVRGLEFIEPDVTAADIGGNEVLKEYGARRIKEFSREAQGHGVRRPRGIVIYGITGTGKSLFAKGIASGVLPILRLDMGTIQEGLVGASENNLKAALKVIDSFGPCVVWVDEGEKMFGGMAGGGVGDSGVGLRLFGQWLTWMQEHTSPAYPIMTCNNIGLFPPEMLGRFDEIFFVDLPTLTERVEILAIHIRKIATKPAYVAEAFDLGAVARATEGYSGRELEKVVSAAVSLSFHAGPRRMTTDDLLEAAADLTPVINIQPEVIAAQRAWQAKRRAKLASRSSETRPAVPEPQAEAGRAPLEID
jgi:AAA+ superfamily predicted ATPase